MCYFGYNFSAYLWLVRYGIWIGNPDGGGSVATASIICLPISPDTIIPILPKLFVKILVLNGFAFLGNQLCTYR